jgi:hypothetical protein
MTEYTAEQLQEIGKKTMETAASLSSLGDATGNVQKAFSALNSTFESALESFSNIKQLTTSQVTTMSGLSALGIKVKEVFASGFELPPIGTFTGQINEFISTFANAPLAEKAAKLSEATKTNVAATKEGINSALKFLITNAQLADQARKTQSALFNMASQAGSLPEILNQARGSADDLGSELSNINEVGAKYGAIMTDAAKATQVPIEEIQKYYLALGRIPGAMNATVESSRNSTEKISMLTGVLQYAAVHGGSTTEVIKDLEIAYRNMGIASDQAMRFTARIGEVSGKFGIELDTVRNSLRSATNDLKLFGGEGLKSGNIIEGSIRIMNNYMQALKDTGLSGSTSVDIIQNMTTQISRLDVAQRAFVSQQTGGPGGLRGAFKVERLIREGKIDELMADVEKTFGRTMGRIVTSKEAEQSEAAASRAIMQRQMLMQGPLGAFARNEQEAARILEAFAAKREGRPVERLSDTIVKDTMSQGLRFQEQSMTYLGDIVANTESLRNIQRTSILGFAQHSTGAAMGTTSYGALEPGTPAYKLAENRRRQQMAGELRSGIRTMSGRLDMGTTSAEIISDITAFIKIIPKALMGPAATMLRLVEMGDDNSVNIAMKTGLDRITQLRQEAAKIRGEKDLSAARRQEAAELERQADEEEMTYNRMSADFEQLRRQIEIDKAKAKQTPPTPAPSGETSAASPRLTPTPVTAPVGPGAQVGAAAARRVAPSTAAGSAGTAGAHGGTVAANAARTAPVDVNVNISGICPHCRELFRTNEQVVATSPAASLGNRSMG